MAFANVSAALNGSAFETSNIAFAPANVSSKIWLAIARSIACWKRNESWLPLEGAETHASANKTRSNANERSSSSSLSMCSTIGSSVRKAAFALRGWDAEDAAAFNPLKVASATSCAGGGETKKFFSILANARETIGSPEIASSGLFLNRVLTESKAAFRTRSDIGENMHASVNKASFSSFPRNACSKILSFVSKAIVWFDSIAWQRSCKTEHSVNG